MRAAVLREYGEPLTIEDRPRPTADPHGAVIAVEACGICRSDWHAWKGHGEWADDRVPPGQILGHEPAGRVVETGSSVSHVAVGDRVCVPFSAGDARCPRCRTGHGNVCADGYAIGFESDAQGAFAEYLHLPHADYNAMAVPDGVALRDVAAVGCRFMTAFHGLAERVDPAAGDWIAIHGCGGLGLAAVTVARGLGARPIAVDVEQEALDHATDLGAVETVDAGRVESVPERIHAITDGGAHASVDALGIAETCRNSIRSLRPRGTHLQLGLTTDDERGEISLPTDWMTRWEITFRGSRGMPPTSGDELFGFLDAAGIDPGALVTREVELAAVSDRLAAMDEYGVAGIEVVTEF